MILLYVTKSDCAADPPRTSLLTVSAASTCSGAGREWLQSACTVHGRPGTCPSAASGVRGGRWRSRTCTCWSAWACGHSAASEACVAGRGRAVEI